MSATFADQPERPSKILAPMMTDLINVDKSNHIDHVILRFECKAPGEGQKLIHRKDKNTDDLFKKMGEGKVELNTLAAVIYDAIVQHAGRNDVEYTFSEHLINPIIQLDGGNVGVKPKGVGETRMLWPNSMLPNREVDAAASADIWKSYTNVPDGKHSRKAVNPSRQIKYQYLTQKDESNDASAIEAAS